MSAAHEPEAPKAPRSHASEGAVTVKQQSPRKRRNPSSLRGREPKLPRLGTGRQATAAREFAAMVRAIDPSVTVYVRAAYGVLDLWAVLPSRDDTAEEAIAEAVCELQTKHLGLRFDFMLVDEASPSVRTIEDSGYERVVPDIVRMAETCRPR